MSVTKHKSFLTIIGCCLILVMLLCCGCDESPRRVDTAQDIQNTTSVVNDLVAKQPTPTDLNYSLERYNLIRRAYWINGQRERALQLPCEITRPLGYVVLFSDSGAVVGRFIVDGKVSYLNHWLTPIEWMLMVSNDKVSYCDEFNRLELPDVDGCYGDNADGIFFFTTDGRYIEWTGDYIYSDIPFEIENPVLKIGG